MKEIKHEITFFVDEDQNVSSSLVFELLAGVKHLDSLNCGIRGMKVEEYPEPLFNETEEDLPF